MNIIGIYGSFGWDANSSADGCGENTWVHDSGATLFMNGKHVASISEERLTRIKHDGNFPTKSIQYCLDIGGIDADDIDYVYIPSMCIDIFYRKEKIGVIEDIVKTNFPSAKYKIISHHLSHAAAAVFTSEFNEGSFMTLDGAGSLIYGKDYNKFYGAETHTFGYFNKKKKIFRFFNGIGNTNLFGCYYNNYAYQAYTRKMEVDIPANDEKHRESFAGKVMGLSAYGDYSKHPEWKDYSISENYSDFPFVEFRSPYISDFQSINNLYRFKSPEDMSSIVQKNFESALLELLIQLKENSYLDDYMCFGGGCFLNVLGNSLMKLSGLFKDIHVPSCPNDTGLHFGAACYANYTFDIPIKLPKNNALLGKKYSDKDILNVLQENFADIKYEKFDSFDELCEKASIYLENNEILGWFQNKSEFGPRALGSRSILMNPKYKENKDILNERVKHREYWRPFAGSILEEELVNYFEEDFNSPHMLYSYTVKEEKREELAAITHVDNTCRVQTVNESLNPEFSKLLLKFKEKTGVPVLLNTSFNDNGEPIVETPLDAIRSYLVMDIDCLVIGNFILHKPMKKIPVNYL
jgi:carbamoyltransferase